MSVSASTNHVRLFENRSAELASSQICHNSELTTHEIIAVVSDKAAPSAADLEAKKGGMKKVETKIGGGLDPAALAAMEKVYSDNGGDLGKIAGQLQVTFKDGVACKDAKDFATRFLNGMITKD